VNEGMIEFFDEFGLSQYSINQRIRVNYMPQITSVLQVAIMSQNIKMVKLLLENGADSNIPTIIIMKFLMFF